MSSLNQATSGLSARVSEIENDLLALTQRQMSLFLEAQKATFQTESVAATAAGQAVAASTYQQSQSEAAAAQGMIQQGSALIGFSMFTGLAAFAPAPGSGALNAQIKDCNDFEGALNNPAAENAMSKGGSAEMADMSGQAVEEQDALEEMADLERSSADTGPMRRKGFYSKKYSDEEKESVQESLRKMSNAEAKEAREAIESDRKGLKDELQSKQQKYQQALLALNTAGQGAATILNGEGQAHAAAELAKKQFYDYDMKIYDYVSSTSNAVQSQQNKAYDQAENNRQVWLAMQETLLQGDCARA